jgi:hypothetical protein
MGTSALRTSLPTTKNSELPAYDAAQPVEHLFLQIEDTMDYADAGRSPYTAAQVVTNVYTLIFNTSMFPESCQE